MPQEGNETNSNSWPACTSSHLSSGPRLVLPHAFFLQGRRKVHTFQSEKSEEKRPTTWKLRCGLDDDIKTVL
jgi:hypothetical protein